jgi:hypothetical protein
MILTKEEKEMLDGKQGDVTQRAMEILVAVGECYDAQEMVRVTSAHLVSANPVAAGKGGAKFIKEMAEGGGKFVIPTTTNVSCVELWSWREMGFSEELYREYLALSEAFLKMGAFLCNTCTPYLVGHSPRIREHIAWGESSAILYANAVLGCRTNREGGPTGLAAAITGRTPKYGYHIDNNRYGKLKIVVNTNLRGITDYSTLGFFTGRIAQDRVPIFTGIPPSVSQEELRCLGAACGTSGSLADYHVVGVTPEAPDERVASGFRKITSSDTFEFGFRELEETEESVSKTGPEAADLVVLGCPHVSINQLKTYAQALHGRKAKREIWILISHVIKRYAEDVGLASIIESAGARLVCGTCPAAMPRGFFKSQGYKSVATDSSKMAYYISAVQDVLCYYGRLDKFIDIITTSNTRR